MRIGTARADDTRLAADLYALDAGNVHDNSIHTDAAHHRGAAAIKIHYAGIGETPVIPIGIAYVNQADTRWAVGNEGCAITAGMTARQALSRTTGEYISSTGRKAVEPRICLSA